MKRVNYRIVGLALVLLGAASGGCARAEPGVEIPLNTIWGYMIPGTRLIQKLEPEHFGLRVPRQEQENLQSSHLWQPIYMAIRRQEEKKPIGPGFAVAGSGYEALVAVKEIMEQDEIPPQTFPAGTEITLFFFTRDLREGFRLKEAKQLEETISIHYQFGTGFQYSDGTRIYHMSSSQHFALIPLGKPSEGKIAVKMIEHISKKDARFARPFFEEHAKKQICKSFVFTIVSEDAEAVSSE